MGAQDQPSPGKHLSRKIPDKKPVNRKDSGKIMSNDKAKAVREFFGDPDKKPPMSPVVEKLLPYLDASSTLHLVQSGISCLKQHLQTTSVVWRKLVNRVRETFEEKRILMASLIDLLKMLDKPDSH